MLSAKDMAALLKAAEKADAKVIMVGDVKQLGSVEAGNAFAQLQRDGGLKTYKLDEVVRQRDANAKAAVYDTIAGNAKSALENIDRCGAVKELKTRDERLSALVTDYMKNNREDRDKSIIITPGKDDRSAVNQAVREAMKKSGELTGPAVKIEGLDKKDIGKTDAALAEKYQPGDKIAFSKDYKSLGVSKGENANVISVDVANNRLVLETKSGERIDINPRTTTRIQAYTPAQREIQAGDRIVFRQNDLTVSNGDAARITKIDGDKVTVKLDSGKQIHLNMKEEKDRHFSHGYAQTAYESQGRTADRVYVHAETHRVNLSDQKAFYVAVSRAKDEIHIYTDDRQKLAAALEERAGIKSEALEADPPTVDLETEKVPEKAPEHEAAPAKTVDRSHGREYER